MVAIQIANESSHCGYCGVVRRLLACLHVHCLPAKVHLASAFDVALAKHAFARQLLPVRVAQDAKHGQALWRHLAALQPLP